MVYSVDLKGRILLALRARNATLTDLANGLGCPRTSLYRWLHVPAHAHHLESHLTEISDVLQVPLPWLKGESVPPPAAVGLPAGQLVEEFAEIRHPVPLVIDCRTRLVLTDQEPQPPCWVLVDQPGARWLGRLLELRPTMALILDPYDTVSHRIARRTATIRQVVQVRP